jgi:hypothetical protein
VADWHWELVTDDLLDGLPPAAMAGKDGIGCCSRRPVMANRRLLPMTAAHDYDDLHHLVDRLSPRQAERLRVLVASDPELASAAQLEAEGAGGQPERRLSVIGIWESGHGDLSERHDEIIRGRLKRPA